MGTRVSHTEKLPALDNKTIITEKHEVLVMWKGHFVTLFNELSTVDQQVVDNIEQTPPQHWMCECSNLNELSVMESLLTQTDRIQHVIDKCTVAKDNGREEWISFCLGLNPGLPGHW